MNFLVNHAAEFLIVIVVLFVSFVLLAEAYVEHSDRNRRRDAIDRAYGRHSLKESNT